MSNIHEFGPFRLDPEAKIVFRGTEPTALGQRAVALLQVLIERAGAPVSKDALINAAWSGLAVEDANLTVQIAALRKLLSEEPGGESWIETLPRRGYRFVGPAVTAHSAIPQVKTPAPRSEGDKPQAAFALPDRPSIAVLPFTNISGDPEQEYFADGMVEEIITALSRMRWLFVIARNSSFTYKGRAVDVKQVGRELGVRYVVEGSVRKAGSRVRITGQLIDATTGAHLWADRFEGSLENIFDLQDQVTISLVSAIAPKMEQAEIERAKRKPTESLDAYDYYLRGMASTYSWTREGVNGALQLFYKAIELDPQFASAYGAAAWVFYWRMVNGWAENRAQEVAEVFRLSRCVAEFGKDDAVSLSFGGLALCRVAGEVEAGVAMTDRALMLNSNLAVAWNASGFLRIFLGNYDLALEHLARATRLNPLDHLSFHTQAVTALAHFLAGRYDVAWPLAERACREQPNLANALRLAAASNACAGRLVEAREFVARALELDPNQRISNLKDRVGPYRPEDFAQFIKGMRLAGLPE